MHTSYTIIKKLYYQLYNIHSYTIIKKMDG